MKLLKDHPKLAIASENQVEVDLVNSLLCLSRSLDYAKPGLMDHHLRVSLLSLYLGRAINLNEDELFELFKAAIIHDIGAVTLEEKTALIDLAAASLGVHCGRGYVFVKDLSFFKQAGSVILSHHDNWAGLNQSGLKRDQIPLASRIIHLVDRIDVLLDKTENILVQREKVLSEIKGFAGVMFDPYLVEIFVDLAGTESIWLDLASPWITDRVADLLPNCQRFLEPEELNDLAGLYARVVDAKSPFTYMHSRGVAQMASFLAKITGMTNRQTFLMNIAGLLHDLGKLTVPEEILLKPATLTQGEMAVMKQHTYFTYWWLKPAFGTLIAEWGAFHHERLDGTGYPFHKSAAELDLGSRIVAVSDIFTALREERPYRASLSWEAIERIMLQQVKGLALDGEIVDILLQNKNLIDEQWRELAEKLKSEN